MREVLDVVAVMIEAGFAEEAVVNGGVEVELVEEGVAVLLIGLRC